MPLTLSMKQLEEIFLAADMDEPEHEVYVDLTTGNYFKFERQPISSYLVKP